ncbi:MAG: 50S ribosomal protein L6 [Candidatus Eisenbacteria bacterium]|nr:50S ribosomal protein L6 [Candidatus Eisenbacteria bacterium]
MSRVGKSPVVLPAGVTATVADDAVTVKGPRGELTTKIVRDVSVSVEGNTLTCERSSETKQAKSSHGTMRALIASMVKGVSEGYVRNLDIIGVGYGAEMKGKAVSIKLGYTHPCVYQVPDGIQIEIPEATRIVVRGVDKQLVGKVAAELRSFKPPEPYKGKGIRYHDEYVKKKAGKLAVSSGM